MADDEATQAYCPHCGDVGVLDTLEVDCPKCSGTLLDDTVTELISDKARLATFREAEKRLVWWEGHHQRSIDALEEKRKKMQAEDPKAKPSEHDRMLYWMEKGALHSVGQILLHLRRDDIKPLATKLGEPC